MPACRVLRSVYYTKFFGIITAMKGRGVFSCSDNAHEDNKMLVPCPECKREISNQATACPHCGCPMKKEQKLDIAGKAKSEDKKGQTLLNMMD